MLLLAIGHGLRNVVNVDTEGKVRRVSLHLAKGASQEEPGEAGRTGTAREDTPADSRNDWAKSVVDVHYSVANMGLQGHRCHCLRKIERLNFSNELQNVDGIVELRNIP